MKSKGKLIPYLVLLMGFGALTVASSLAREFEIFDGRVYNGKFYPRIDIIEWGNPVSHMEFHVYSKSKPVDMAFELERKTGRPVMLVRYHLKDRGEYLCRRVLAPSHFLEKFKVYKDTSDPDMDNTIVSMEPIDDKPGLVEVKQPVTYATCEEPKDDRFPAAEAATVHNDSAATPGKEAPAKAAGTDPNAGFNNW